ncbi:hypothetical protein HMPREF1144_4795 [Klebsiella sp. OBRC7]|nr:hypothetical protein HMPREF1144_4795 [Klebsiella sp. OBRC7]
MWPCSRFSILPLSAADAGQGEYSLFLLFALLPPLCGNGNSINNEY